MTLLGSASLDPAGAQERVVGIDFTNDRLPIPDSEKYDEGQFIDSGVGLSFGVDKRLTYYAGQYEEAAARFELAVGAFKYKSEIWVFLARSYFNMKSPGLARETLERAEEVMPDLREKLWQPLLGSLLWEIRKRANQQQVQIDFYSQDQNDFFSLFRLYTFLEDFEGAAGVITSAQGKDRTMRQLATTVSGGSRKAYLKQAAEWGKLAVTLRQELRSEAPDVEVESAADLHPASANEPASGDGNASDTNDEETRVLQLKIDFYQAAAKDYETLFGNYFDRGDRQRAGLVLAALDREIGRQGLLKSVAPTVQREVEIETQLEELDELKRKLESTLGPPDGADGL